MTEITLTKAAHIRGIQCKAGTVVKVGDLNDKSCISEPCAKDLIARGTAEEVKLKASK